MKIINQFLMEYAPDHPDDIVVRNKYYPKGLKSKQIYNYYISQKQKILKWINNRNVAFLIKIDDNTTVIKRNINGKPIQLNTDNFDDLITGRTNVIYVVHPSNTSYYIIDIDPGSNLTRKESLLALKILLLKLKPKKYEVLNSGSVGIHLICHLPNKHNLDTLRNDIKEQLISICDDINKKSKIQFLVDSKGRKPNTINFDLSSMQQNSLHIAKYSLTKEFLICSDSNNGLKKIR